ncbi:hypothetical protein DTO96_102157 [Ephemeroptericola cinctiostellae]|uniref:Uncharacterized protein n=2 Tax=Ephemeroptericola cinctiostellae TaxID=2268024 RepID=A0A345DDG5_9BURK|nr:hypothetical protein DTO96_102157 [Ephemeroptericola cinctiostellae]
MLLQDEQHTLEQTWLVALVSGDGDALADLALDGTQLAVTDSALARLNCALRETKNLMDGYLRSAGVSLPLSDEQIAQTPLKTCNASLARCWLRDDDENATDLGSNNCKSWRAWLRDIAAKKVSLFANDVASTVATTVGEVRHGRGRTGFDDQWRGYP